MEDIRLKRLSAPVVTGNPRPAAQQTAPKGASFQEVLKSSLAFSKHAATRAAQRNIDLSESSMERLNAGVRLAEEKGLQEPLILVGGTAFIVSVKNNTVITTIEGSELQGSVFTNIDGTVII